MPDPIEAAFNKFLESIIDLSPDIIDKALASRSYLIKTIKKLALTNKGFPQLYGDPIDLSPFARGTQIKPLDNLDILLLINGAGTEVNQSPLSETTYWLKLTHLDVPLSLFPDKYSYVSSIKILNSFKNYLASVNTQAEINPYRSAVSFSFTNYDWTFSLIPAVPVDNKDGQRIYYLIPDIKGNWKRINPQSSPEYIAELNTKHSAKLLPTIKLLKYWNLLSHNQSLPEYYLETLVIKIFQEASPITDLKKALLKFFDNCHNYLLISSNDLKSLNFELEGKLDVATLEKVALAMKETSTFVSTALMYEERNEIALAFNTWQHIFGEQFPKYS